MKKKKIALIISAVMIIIWGLIVICFNDESKVRITIGAVSIIIGIVLLVYHIIRD